MVDLRSHGLSGLTAMLIIAFCLAYGDALPLTREKPTYELINNAQMNDSPMIETGPRSLRFRGDVGKQRETAPASLPQRTWAIETSHGAIYSDSFRNDRGPLEAFRG
jgi:hypothetical protein